MESVVSEPAVGAVSAHPRRTVLVLVLCQALAMTGTTMLIVVSALAGQELAPDPALATLPISLMFVATMATTIPASLLMKRAGRRAGFTLGAAIGMAAAAVAALAIIDRNFGLFLFGGILQGMYNAFWQYYRFAAADTVEENFKSRAISYVMAGGIAAAVAGPEIAKLSAGYFEQARYAGTYAVMVGLAAVAILLLRLIDIPLPGAEERAGSGRPIGRIAAQPTFIVAVMSALIGYGVMSFMMTATPLAMDAHAHSFTDTAFVIQWHALGMFVPSFFTGHLIRRFGTVRIILTGAAAMFGAIAVNLSGTGVPQFWAALLLLGIGWNFMFIGGTTLLTEVYTLQEKAKVQAVNDFLVFGATAIASLSSGVIHHAFGWQAINYGVIAPVAIVGLAALWLRLKRRAAGRDG